MLTVEQVRAAMAHATKLSPVEGMARASNLLREGREVDLIIKVSEDQYKDWFTTKRPTSYLESLEDETTYITTNENKAFDSGKGGYSIFATSIATRLRNERGMAQMNEQIERIEHLRFDWIIIVDSYHNYQGEETNA